MYMYVEFRVIDFIEFHSFSNEEDLDNVAQLESVVG